MNCFASKSANETHLLVVFVNEISLEKEKTNIFQSLIHSVVRDLSEEFFFLRFSMDCLPSKFVASSLEKVRNFTFLVEEVPCPNNTREIRTKIIPDTGCERKRHNSFKDVKRIFIRCPSQLQQLLIFLVQIYRAGLTRLETIS